MEKYLSEAGLTHFWTEILKPLFNAKVDKVTGKGLSSLDFTQIYLNRIGAAEDAVTTLGSTKVDKIGGKGLSTNDFTTAYKDLIEQNTAGILELSSTIAQTATGVTRTATLPTSGWSGTGPYTYAASVTGVTEDNVVLAGPAPASKSEYEACGAYPSAQGDGTLTFTAQSVPTIQITANVVILNL